MPELVTLPEEIENLCEPSEDLPVAMMTQNGGVIAEKNRTYSLRKTRSLLPPLQKQCKRDVQLATKCSNKSRRLENEKYLPHSAETDESLMVCCCKSDTSSNCSLNELQTNSSTRETNDILKSADRKRLQREDSASSWTTVSTKVCFTDDDTTDKGSNYLSDGSCRSGGINEDLNSLCLCDEQSQMSDLVTDESEKLPNLTTLPGENYQETDIALLPILISLFPHFPPTLRFFTNKQKVLSLPDEIKKHLIWKLSSITPAIIRQVVNHTGFSISDETKHWYGTWGKHMKCANFKSIKDNQKVNHFPGSFNLGRKDRLWQNLTKFRSLYPDLDEIMPETYVLPQDMNALKKAWKEEINHCWIIKPPALARGTGIKVIHKWSQIPKKQPIIVQKYISDPYLIDGTKFDLRVYVLITSFDPLRIYVFDNGLVRFASMQYTNTQFSLSERYIHLTNYSINRKSSTYTVNEDESECKGHKWSLKALWNYMTEQNVDVEKLQKSIVDVILKTTVSCESAITRLIKLYARRNYTCYELFGFDIMLDKNLKPWLLEVNISPSLHSSSSLDLSIKEILVKDMFTIVGYEIPDNINGFQQAALLEEMGISLEMTKYLCMDTNLHHPGLSAEEKLKHSTFENDPSYQELILNELTPDDVRILAKTEDEYSRRGNFVRIFPAVGARHYLKYFEHSRYYNLLLDAWEMKYCDNRNDGIALIQNLCMQEYHLQTSRGLSAVHRTPSSRASSATRNEAKSSQEERNGTAARSELHISKVKLKLRNYSKPKFRTGKLCLSPGSKSNCGGFSSKS